jgi:hypothetical protein
MTERNPNQPTGSQTPPPAANDAPTVAWTPPPNGTIEAAPVATTAVPVRTSRGGGLRWGIALLITVVILGIGAVAALLLTGQSAPSSLVGYAPADSLIYGELRLDLPGDQRQKLGQFLSKFPGFKDQATMPTKVDEVLDRVVQAMTSNQQDFSTHIKPWFGGELGFSLSAFGATATGATAPDKSRGLALITVTDTTKARAWLDGILGDKPRSTADHNGTQLLLVGDGPTKAAMAIHGKVMLVGDEASVRAAVDTNGAGPLPSSARFASALESVAGDSLAYLFIDLDRYLTVLASATEGMPDGMGAQLDEASRALIPDWAMVRLQARGDAIAIETATPHIASPVKSTNRAGELAPQLPASTIVLLDGRDVGDYLLNAIAMARANLASAEAFKQIDQVAILFGGFDGILGWIRDGGIALTRDGDKLDGGVVFSPKDRAAGERLLATLRSYAVLGGGQAGLQVAVRDEPYAGTTISIIDLGDWRDIAALAGGGTVVPFEGRLEIAYAATDDVIVLALGDSFVKAVLDAKSGASLANDARYKSLIERVGAQNVGSAYLDVTAVRELIEGAFSKADPAGFATYQVEYQPYLVPLDAYIQAAVTGDVDRLIGMVVVK